MEFISAKLSDYEFDRISGLVYSLCGISLGSGKKELVTARLARRLNELKLQSYDAYLKYLSGDESGYELLQLIDVITTNVTSFFREMHHFDYIKEHILPEYKSKSNKIRIWSAGCSSGEEPYSMAVLLFEEIGNLMLRDVKILATDISTNILSKAKEGVYDKQLVNGVPKILLTKYFEVLTTKDEYGRTVNYYKVKSDIRSVVRFARLNLMDDWPMKGPFKIIFCRNVMIYFDKKTQEKLVAKYHGLLENGGHLFIGHSENLSPVSHSFKYVQPGVYLKC
jgi:chemotaxis protein methyltransferase CheR